MPCKNYEDDHSLELSNDLNDNLTKYLCETMKYIIGDSGVEITADMLYGDIGLSIELSEWYTQHLEDDAIELERQKASKLYRKRFNKLMKKLTKKEIDILLDLGADIKP